MEKRLNDKRVKKILVLDVETIGVGEKAIYDSTIKEIIEKGKGRNK